MEEKNQQHHVEDHGTSDMALDGNANSRDVKVDSEDGVQQVPVRDIELV